MISQADWTGCTACGCPYFREVPYKGGTHAGLRFDVIRLCQQCHLGRAYPAPTQPQLDAFYRSGAYWHASGSHPAQQAHENVQSTLRVKWCLPHLPQTNALRVLDVGAGHGFIADWLARLRPKGIDSYSFVEPDRQQAQLIGDKRLDFAVHAREELPRDDVYDLIFLNHVLEHVADPREFMRRITQLLTPDGIAYIETPHLDFRFKDDVFPHTFFFTPAAFEALGGDLPIATIACESFGAWPGNAGGITAAAHRWLARLFVVGVKTRWTALQSRVDQTIWRYDRTGDGIWLRWLIRRKNTPASRDA